MRTYCVSSAHEGIPKHAANKQAHTQCADGMHHGCLTPSHWAAWLRQKMGNWQHGFK